MKISDIADIINVTEKDPSNSGIDVFVGLEHYDIAEPVIKRFGSTKMLSTAAKKFEAGDVLIARRNVYLQRASVARFAGLTSGDSIVLRVKKNLKIEGTDYETMCQLLPFILNSINFWDYANTNADGTMSKRLSPAILQDYEFDIPSIDEQKVLAEKLWAAYEVKQSYLKMIDATQEMVKAQFIDMFKNSCWPVKPLSELCEIITDGEHQTPRRVDSGIFLLSARNIQNQNLSLDVVDFIDEQEYKRISKRIVPQEGDILVSCSGSVGRTCVVPKGLKFQLVRSVALLRVKPDLYPLFLSYQMAMPSVQRQIDNLKSKTSQANLFQGNIKKIRVIVPTKKEQHYFISIVTQADKSISELRKSIDAIDKVIKSLINENL